MQGIKTQFDSPAVTPSSYFTPFMSVKATLRLYDEELSGCIEFSGLIAGSDVQALSKFLRKLARIPTERWVLHLNEVSALSLKGLQAILKFARFVQKRGAAVVIRQTNPVINNLMQELDVSDYFGLPWPENDPAK